LHSEQALHWLQVHLSVQFSELVEHQPSQSPPPVREEVGKEVVVVSSLHSEQALQLAQVHNVVHSSELVEHQAAQLLAPNTEFIIMAITNIDL